MREKFTENGIFSKYVISDVYFHLPIFQGNLHKSDILCYLDHHIDFTSPDRSVRRAMVLNSSSGHNAVDSLCCLRIRRTFMGTGEFDIILFRARQFSCYLFHFEWNEVLSAGLTNQAKNAPSKKTTKRCE